MNEVKWWVSISYLNMIKIQKFYIIYIDKICIFLVNFYKIYIHVKIWIFLTLLKYLKK